MSKISSAFAIVFLLFTGAAAQSGRVTPSHMPTTLHVQEKQFLQYAQDFLDFAKSKNKSDDMEYQISYSLYNEAMLIHDRLEKYAVLFDIYGSMLCKGDKSIVGKSIGLELKFDRQQNDVSLEAINLGIADTKSPGVAAEAIRMREDLRKVQGVLSSLRLE
jgi:hypothetical protein